MKVLVLIWALAFFGLAEFRELEFNLVYPPPKLETVQKRDFSFGNFDKLPKCKYFVP